MTDFRIDTSKVDALTRALGATAREVRIALRRAGRRTGTRGRSLIIKAIREEYRAKVTPLRKRIGVANRRNDVVITLGNRRIPVNEFFARQNSSGTSVGIRRGQRAKLLRGAFFGQGSLRPDVVYGRPLRGGGRVPRLPVVPLTGPAPAEMYEGSPAGSKIDERLLDFYERRFERELTFAVNQTLKRKF